MEAKQPIVFDGLAALFELTSRLMREESSKCNPDQESTLEVCDRVFEKVFQILCEQGQRAFADVHIARSEGLHGFEQGFLLATYLCKRGLNIVAKPELERIN